MLLPTTLVGSYPQPDWLIDRPKLSKQVPRVRAHDLWLVDPQRLDGAQNDATLLAIADQERAGLDIITDGEQRRQRFDSYFFRFNGLDTVRLAPWPIKNRDMSFIDLDSELAGRLAEAQAPRVVGQLTWS